MKPAGQGNPGPQATAQNGTPSAGTSMQSRPEPLQSLASRQPGVVHCPSASGSEWQQQ